MRGIKDQNLAQLLMQLRFTPQKKRLTQLDAAEKLLTLIEPDRQYPFDFVCFRITGFHPRKMPAHLLIKGSDLADDLQVFIAKLSGRLAQRLSEQKQKVYTVEELAEKFDISTKTVHRWRKRGLLARRFVFDDGRKRLGMPQSAVEQFLRKNPDIIARARNFKRLTNKQKQQVIKRAIALAANTTMSRHQVIDQVARKTGRAHETVRYTILDYERDNPDRRVFRRPPGVIDPAQAAELYRLYKQGLGITELMEHFDRSKSSVYRIINRRRARTLLARKIEFVASDDFLEENAAQSILAKPLNLKGAKPETAQKFSELAAESPQPEYLHRLKDTPVLDRETEAGLFRRYNYLKYLACIRRAGINPAGVKSARLKEIEQYIAEADNIKEMLIEANLRLVISIAMKHAAGGANLSDLVSDGNVSLMRAVESFDYARGFRFSSHASWTIAKDYARKAPGRTAGAGKTKAATLADIHRGLKIKAAAGIIAVERARQDLTEVIRQELNDRERHVILNHFGLLGSTVKKKKKTLKQIGEHLGLTKERVRQIELVALQKLRQSLSPEQFELLTG